MRVLKLEKVAEFGTSFTFVRVLELATIARLAKTSFVGNDVVIGNNCKVQNNVSVYDAVTLEDDVFCGPSMVFTNVYNPRSAVIRKDEYRKTLVMQGATLGANSTMVCGVTHRAICFCRGRGCY